jgi:hypothetical protein
VNSTFLRLHGLEMIWEVFRSELLVKIVEIAALEARTRTTRRLPFVVSMESPLNTLGRCSFVSLGIGLLVVIFMARMA